MPGRYRFTFDCLNTDLAHSLRGTLILDFIRLTDNWQEGVAGHSVFPGDETLPAECRMTFLVGPSDTRTIAAKCG